MMVLYCLKALDHASYELNVMHHVVFQIACYRVSNPSHAVCPWFLLFSLFLILSRGS